MARRARPQTLKMLPARAVAAKAGMVGAIILMLILMVLSRSSSPLALQSRAVVNDIVAPIAAVLSTPAEALRNVGGWASDIATLRQQNITMKAQLKAATIWQGKATRLQAENEALRSLIRVVPEGAVHAIAARVVGDVASPYVRSVLINGGLADGIQNGQAVLAVDGLVGRVVEAGRGSARVLLLTDINARVPVIGEHSRERSIATGNNTELLSLDYVPSTTSMKVGERLMTSGDGGVFPPGVPVGVVTSVESGVVKLQPFTDWSRLEFVSVAEYDF